MNAEKKKHQFPGWNLKHDIGSNTNNDEQTWWLRSNGLKDLGF